MSLRLAGVSKQHGRGRRAVVALDSVDFDLDSGQLLVLVGPSGSGKSTLLRVVAGLDPPDAGTVEVGGRDVTDLPPGEREVAMVFQDLALYPHLTVGDNVRFDLRASGADPGASSGRVDEVVERLELGALIDRRPGELSGGERQRAALARALVRRPALLLLDEPFSSIDAEHRSTYRRDLRRHQRELGLTTVHVTHDSREAMSLADRIVVLDAGRVQQVGTPQEVWHRPATIAVARRFGDVPINVLPAGLARAGARGSIAIRPADLAATRPSEPRAAGHVPLGAGIVTDVSDLGDQRLAVIRAGGSDLLSEVRPGATPPRGGEVALSADPATIHHFDDDDRRIERS